MNNLPGNDKCILSEAVCDPRLFRSNELRCFYCERVVEQLHNPDYTTYLKSFTPLYWVKLATSFRIVVVNNLQWYRR